MIYFDNSATSRPKPEEVYNAFDYYVRENGASPGRGSYSIAVDASRMLYQTRKTVARFFGISDVNNIVFTKNSTEAINLFLNGFLNWGDHVLIDPYEHNAILRPIQTLKNEGRIDYSVISVDDLENPNELEKYIRPNTKLVALSLASNLTGQIIFTKELAKKANELGVKVFVDSSQGAGKKLINMDNDYVDFLAFTGHKDLLGLPGTGGLVSKNTLKIRPLIQGGTGVHGESYINPEIYPEAYESGTLNMPRIWALNAAITFIENNFDEISRKESALIHYAISELSKDERIIIYNKDKARVPTFCFNIRGKTSSEVIEYLNSKDVCVRGGLHCAIKAHESINTVAIGAIRVSLNFYNTFEEIDQFCTIIGDYR